MNFEQKVDKVLKDHKEILMAKNKAYGNSALEPVRIFSKVDAVEQLKVRIDDKLSRLAKGTDFADEDTITDLLGYLILLKVAEGVAQEWKDVNTNTKLVMEKLAKDTLSGKVNLDTSTKLKEVMEEDETKYKWIARDKDGQLYQFTHKPEANEKGNFYTLPTEEITDMKKLDNSLYPEVTYENSPIKLEDLEKNVWENPEIKVPPKYKENEYLEQGEVGYMDGKLVKCVASSSLDTQNLEGCKGCTFYKKGGGLCNLLVPNHNCFESYREDDSRTHYEEVKE